MSFIEDKRTEIKTAAQVEQLVKDEKEALLRQVAEERVFHLHRKNEATAIRQESGVGTLVRKLGEILQADKVSMKDPFNGICVTRSRGNSTGPDYAPDYATHGFLDYPKNPEYPTISLTDPDSTIDIAIWDIEEDNGPYGPSTIRFKRLKVLGVEARPDGDVVFHAHAGETTSNLAFHRMCVTETIQEQTWRNTPEVLEEALERAFNKPAIFDYTIAPEKEIYVYSPMRGYKGLPSTS